MTHIKTSEGYDVKVPSQGEVTYGTVAGSLGIASFLGLNANNLLGGVFGGNRCGGYKRILKESNRSLYESGIVISGMFDSFLFSIF
jgi:hypothetical protein